MPGPVFRFPCAVLRDQRQEPGRYFASIVPLAHLNIPTCVGIAAVVSAPPVAVCGVSVNVLLAAGPNDPFADVVTVMAPAAEVEIDATYCVGFAVASPQPHASAATAVPAGAV